MPEPHAAAHGRHGLRKCLFAPRRARHVRPFEFYVLSPSSAPTNAARACAMLKVACVFLSVATYRKCQCDVFSLKYARVRYGIRDTRNNPPPNAACRTMRVRGRRASLRRHPSHQC